MNFRERIVASLLAEKLGNRVMVKSCPDYNGGRFVTLVSANNPLGEFEYIEDSGTCAGLLCNNNTYEEWVEPFHESRKEWEVSFVELALQCLELPLNFMED